MAFRMAMRSMAPLLLLLLPRLALAGAEEVCSAPNVASNKGNSARSLLQTAIVTPLPVLSTDSDEKTQELELVQLDTSKLREAMGVLPVSLGLEAVPGYVEVYPKGSVYPGEQVTVLTTSVNGQTGADIRVYAGDSKEVSLNKLVGTVTLTGITSQAAHEAHVKVTFALDAAGALTVTAVDQEDPSSKATQTFPKDAWLSTTPTPEATPSPTPPPTEQTFTEQCIADPSREGCDLCRAPPLLIQENEATVPQTLMTCKCTPLSQTQRLTCDQYDKVAAVVTKELEALGDTCTVDSCPKAEWAGCVLRMTGHDFMDFDGQVGGADACLDLTHPDNKGLAECLVHGKDFGVSLDDIYHRFCIEVSLADFLVISAEAVMKSARVKAVGLQEAGLLNFRSQFKYGRMTKTECPPGALPNPEVGCSDVERVFVNNMGLGDWRKAAALMGVHSLGRARKENSGYDGWWSDPENSALFNNNYYVSIIAKGWCPEKEVAGNEHKNQWQRCEGNLDENVHGHEMMLNTDMCLVYRDAQGGELSAKDDPCCAWVHTMSDQYDVTSMVQPGASFCNLKCGEPAPQFDGGIFNCLEDSHQQKTWELQACCAKQLQADNGQRSDCQTISVAGGGGPAEEHVRVFATNERAWITAFLEAWAIATTNGFQNLKPLESC